jgi:hypothetical protein
VVDDADATLIALADELTRRPGMAGEVLDGPPAAAPGLPARAAQTGAPAGAGPAIPGLQLTA